MPLNLDANQVPNSSDGTTLDDATENQQLDTEQQVEGADGADSSDAHGENVTQDTLGIVRDVVTGREEATASPADGNEQQESEDPVAAEDDKGEGDDYADAPFNKHPRFKHLIKVRDALKAERNELKEDAGRYRNVQKFIEDNGLGNEEVANAYIFMAKVKRGDYVEAWELIKPTVQQLLVAAGEVLPEDLKQEVAAGTMSQERAIELSRERAKSASLQQGRSFDEQVRQRNDASGRSKQLHDTAIAWSHDRAKRDPQFDAKMPLLKKEVAWLQSQSRGQDGFDKDGRPTTSEGVKAQLEQAYKAVVLPATAARPAVNRQAAPKVGDGMAKPRLTAGGGASGTARPKPKSTLDIINRVVEARAG